MADSGIAFSVKVTGADAIGRALVGLQLRGQNLRPVLDDIGASLLTSTQRRFEDEAGPDGSPWPGIERDGAILRDTGRLYQSLTYQVGPNAVELGTNLIYARIHQLGGQAGRGHAVTIQPRPYLGLDAEDEREIHAIIGDYIQGGLA